MKPGIRFWTLAVAVASMTVPALAQTPGADTYQAKCAMCHGADGLAASQMAKMLQVQEFTHGCPYGVLPICGSRRLPRGHSAGPGGRG